MRAHIHTAVLQKGIKPCERQYGYIIRPEGKDGYSEGFGAMEGTYQATVLTAITEALDRFTQTDRTGKPVRCDVIIHSPDKGVLHHAQNSMEKHWQFNGWKNARGEDIRNKRYWEGMYNKLRSFPSYRFAWAPEDKSISYVVAQRIREHDAVGANML